MGWLMVIGISAALVVGTFGLIRWHQSASEAARKARLAAIDERMKNRYRLKLRTESTLPPRPPLKSKKKRK